jgi:hypothetical protein
MTTSQAPLDAERFEQQVASIADQLAAVWTGTDDLKEGGLGVASAADKDRVIERVLNQVFEDATAGAGDALGHKSEIRAAALEARAALQTPSIRTTLCRVLSPLRGTTTREITIELAKVSLPLVLTGQIAVSASPLVWGLLGFTAAWLGTSWLCGEQT